MEPFEKHVNIYITIPLLSAQGSYRNLFSKLLQSVIVCSKGSVYFMSKTKCLALSEVQKHYGQINF